MWLPPPAPAAADKLALYGLFKQGTVGDNTTAKPGMLDFKGKAKWEAWEKQKGELRGWSYRVVLLRGAPSEVRRC